MGAPILGEWLNTIPEIAPDAEAEQKRYLDSSRKSRAPAWISTSFWSCGKVSESNIHDMLHGVANAMLKQRIFPLSSVLALIVEHV